MKWKTPLRNQKGFTLIEIAIVLIIIGLILGATVKGSDLIQSAKQKKFYNNFVKQWEITTLNYLDRTGGLLGDGTINGGVAAAPNGYFDGIDNAGEFATINTRLGQVGLEPPPITAIGTNYQYSIKGRTSGTRTVAIQLYQRNSIENAVNIPNNVLRFVTMPTDLALALDGMIDGTTNGSLGKFRQDPNGAWPNAATTPTVTAMYILDVP